MLIKLKPLDTLFFRDSRPFNKGDETWANGIFPPYPSVFYGAIRSAYFSHNINELEKANKDDDPTKNLIINNIIFSINDDYYFPLPKDLVRKKNVKVSVYPLVLQEISQYIHSGKTQSILTPSSDLQDKVESVQDGLIEECNFTDYLLMENSSFSSNKSIKFPYCSILDYVKAEPKIGIERNNSSHSSEEGMLYRVGMNRCDNFSFVLDFDGLNLPEKGFMKIGGEGKAVSYEKIEELISQKSPEITGDMFKVYISTPAIFSKGWLQGWLDPLTLEGKVRGTESKVKLITAALTKPIQVGGYDIERDRPKPMRRAVGAGSVYYFRIIEGNMDEIIRTIHCKSLSDEEHDRKQGFGISYIGRA